MNKAGTLASKEASIFDAKSWCSGCAPTYPLANVVSSNAQRVAANSDNMMEIYRKTTAGLSHVNRELGDLVGMQRQVNLSPAEDTSPYSSPYTSSGPDPRPLTSPYTHYGEYQYVSTAARPAAPARAPYGYNYDYHDVGTEPGVCVCQCVCVRQCVCVCARACTPDVRTR
jgi:hypothetical protein